MQVVVVEGIGRDHTRSQPGSASGGPGQWQFLPGVLHQPVQSAAFPVRIARPRIDGAGSGWGRGQALELAFDLLGRGALADDAPTQVAHAARARASNRRWWPSRPSAGSSPRAASPATGRAVRHRAGRAQNRAGRPDSAHGQAEDEAERPVERRRARWRARGPRCGGGSATAITRLPMNSASPAAMSADAGGIAMSWRAKSLHVGEAVHGDEPGGDPGEDRQHPLHKAAREGEDRRQPATIKMARSARSDDGSCVEHRASRPAPTAARSRRSSEPPPAR